MYSTFGILQLLGKTNHACFEKSWNARLTGKIFRAKLGTRHRYGYLNKERQNTAITREEYQWCFNHCKVRGWCESFQVVVKKQFVKKNVICRLSSSDSHEKKRMNEKKYTAAAIGFPDCSKYITTTKSIVYF